MKRIDETTDLLIQNFSSTSKLFNTNAKNSDYIKKKHFSIDRKSKTLQRRTNFKKNSILIC